MKKQHEKRTKRDNTAWGDEAFEIQKKKGLKNLAPTKRFRPQDLRFDEEY